MHVLSCVYVWRSFFTLSLETGLLGKRSDNDLTESMETKTERGTLVLRELRSWCLIWITCARHRCRSDEACYDRHIYVYYKLFYTNETKKRKCMIKVLSCAWKTFWCLRHEIKVSGHHRQYSQTIYYLSSTTGLSVEPFSSTAQPFVSAWHEKPPLVLCIRYRKGRLNSVDSKPDLFCFTRRDSCESNIPPKPPKCSKSVTILLFHTY